MAQDEIVEKLKVFLEAHTPLREECEAVYLMVELRKLIDRAGERDRFSHLKFYADWAVHSEKDRLTPAMVATIGRMHREAVAEIKADGVVTTELKTVRSFAYMDSLKVEMAQALSWFGIRDNITDRKLAWLAFVSTLVRVLENQPIKARLPGVESVAFIPAAPGCVWGRLTFDAPIDGHSHFDYKNAY